MAECVVHAYSIKRHVAGLTQIVLWYRLCRTQPRRNTQTIQQTVQSSVSKELHNPVSIPPLSASLSRPKEL